MCLKQALTNISQILEKLLERDIIKSRKRSKTLYYKMPVAFDIEATNYKDGDDIKCGICYFWSLALTQEDVYTGRTLEEFVEVLRKINGALASSGAYLVIYVHNFAYEFQFLRGLLEWDDVFLTDRRRPLYARTMCFEFRCSYMLSNMSLDSFLKNNNCTVQKLQYDYNKKRYPWTDLTDEEELYCAHDTAGLLEAIATVMEKEGDTIASIPLTSTGYVRRDVKHCETISLQNKIKRINALTPDLYYALNKAFIGGNTHANKMYAGELLCDVTCYDITSSYPYAQLCCAYPVEPFRRKVKGLDAIRLDENFAYLLHIRFYDIALRDYFDGMPIISLSKCIDFKDIDNDNGRIMSAKYIEVWITDIEYGLISNHYEWRDMEVKGAYFSRYGEIPEEIKATIYTYFENKCTLKLKDPYLYRKSKEKLNAIYGMSAFDVGKRRYSYVNEDYERDERAITDILFDSIGKGTQAEPYAWGVWTTANARKNLDEMIRRAGDRFIYCDTDSVYVLGDMDDEAEEINERVKEKSAPYKVHFNSKDYYLGVWNKDKHCRRFITLGAKKYAYEDDNGLVHTVTAGVSKRAGVEKIEDYKVGHIFKNATNTIWYTDEETELTIEGHNINVPSSAYIEPNDYTLGVTNVYYALLAYLNDGDSGESYWYI